MVVGKLPLQFRRAFARALGAIIGSLPLRDTLVARLQISHFLPQENPRSVARGVFQEFCLTFLESLNLFPILKHHEESVVIEDWAGMQKWADHESGLIILTAHTCNWELLAAYMQKIGLRYYALGREARHPAGQAMLSTVREMYEVKTLWRHDGAGVKQIIRELKAGGGIAALIDQDTNVSSAFAPFFGVACKTPVALVSLAQKLGSHICTLFITREGTSNYRITWSPIDNAQSPVEILNEYNRKLEKVVREHPNQWAWFHKRWRSRPDGRKFSTRDYIRGLKTEPNEVFRDAEVSAPPARSAAS
jgi:KDO2-lipid IV(A) lauroyltransferase